MRRITTTRIKPDVMVIALMISIGNRAPDNGGEYSALVSLVPYCGHRLEYGQLAADDRG